MASPTIQDVDIERGYVAEIRAAKRAEVRSRFRGLLESVSVDEGQRVKAGQTLFTIDARTRKQELAVAHAATLAARAELAAASLDVQNTKLLADKNVVSQAELARARSKVDILSARLAKAKAAEARARVELDRARLRAPFDGVVNSLPFKAGSAIGADELLTTVTDTTEVLAYFSISEREYLELSRDRRGDGPRSATLVLADGTTFEQRGTIDAVGGELDADNGTLVYRARFPNPDGLLKHGASGKVILESRLHDALVIPQKSTFEVQGNVYVYVVAHDRTVHARKIAIGSRLEDTFVVASGLERGERFVVEGIQQLEEGMQIEPQQPTTPLTSSPRS